MRAKPSKNNQWEKKGLLKMFEKLDNKKLTLTELLADKDTFITLTNEIEKPQKKRGGANERNSLLRAQLSLFEKFDRRLSTIEEYLLTEKNKVKQ